MPGLRQAEAPRTLRKPGQVAAIVDCYTVEPSGLGVPPYLSVYARGAFAALKRAFPGADVRYLTIDDVRWYASGSGLGPSGPDGVPLGLPGFGFAARLSCGGCSRHADHLSLEWRL